ncbi:MAG TPA: glutamate racemase [Caldilineae bacterium]|nr:glutamate racemase [Caldilineae bacterium]
MGAGSDEIIAVDRPIGLFDSGVGGLSVWRAVVQRLPNESTLYLADQVHVPYGARPRAEIEALTHKAVAWLLAQNVKLVVIACNTASAAALDSLRQRWPKIPIVGMEPAVKPASARTVTGKVGIMATPGTLQAERFHLLVERFAGGVDVYTQICPGLVEMVEAGQLDGQEIDARLHLLLDPLTDRGIDQLVLGCTHYPFLAPAIQRAVGQEVTLIDPAPAVAKQVQNVLASRQQLAPPAAVPDHRFTTTAAADAFAATIRRLVGVEAPRTTHLATTTAIS